MAIPTVKKVEDEIKQLWVQIEEENERMFGIKYIIESNSDRHRKVWLSIKEVPITENLKEPMILWFIIDQQEIQSSVDDFDPESPYMEVGFINGLRNGIFKYIKEHPGRMNCFFMDYNPEVNQSLLENSLKTRRISRLVFENDSSWWKLIFERAFQHFCEGMVKEAEAGNPVYNITGMRQRWNQAVTKLGCNVIVKRFLAKMSEDSSVERAPKFMSIIKLAKRKRDSEETSNDD